MLEAKRNGKPLEIFQSIDCENQENVANILLNIGCIQTEQKLFNVIKENVKKSLPKKVGKQLFNHPTDDFYSILEKSKTLKKYTDFILYFMFGSICVPSLSFIKVSSSQPL